jgi:large subunit ribosomal protein L10
MSKVVKELVMRDLRNRLKGVEDAVVVSTVGMDAITTHDLRTELSKKDIRMLVIKNSLARRACDGTRIAPAFDGANGQLAVCFGGTDFIALVKEVIRLHKDDKKFAKFEARGGVMDGERLDSKSLEDVSKWPSREEQISMLVGQILGVGADLSAALLGPGGTVGGQIKQKGEGEEGAEAEASG